MKPGEEVGIPIKEHPNVAWSIVTVPRSIVGSTAEERETMAGTFTSWCRAGASEVVLLVEDKFEFDVKLLGLPLDVVSKVRVARGLQVSPEGIPYVSSALHLADANATSPYVVWGNSDCMTPQFFGATLTSLLARLGPEKEPFLVVGHRLFLNKNPARLFLDGVTDQQLWDQYRLKSGEPNPHAMDLFVWNRGQWSGVPVPDFLIGRNIWGKQVVCGDDGDDYEKVILTFFFVVHSRFVDAVMGYLILALNSSWERSMDFSPTPSKKQSSRCPILPAQSESG